MEQGKFFFVPRNILFILPLSTLQMNSPQSQAQSLLSEENIRYIANIAEMFAIEGEFLLAEEIHSGLINATYRVTYKKSDGVQERYILQRINASVFKDPKAVMRNVERVTRHINWKVLRVRKDASGQTLHLYPARGGKFYTLGPNGGYWRCYNNLEGTHTYDIVENTKQAYQAAYAFGAFQDLVSDMPIENIVEGIPDFHHTRKRFDRLMEAVKADSKQRLQFCLPEINFIKERESDVDRLLDMQKEGKLPTRITHNDTKINNVMLDEHSDEAVCVIDLDTVMPGLSLYDFGDMVRTATSPAREDETDLSQVMMQIPMFEALVQGYLDAAGGFLVQQEIDELAFSGKLITLEIAIRFLTDYLEGDLYFKTRHENHNLDRARNQLKLVEDIETKMEIMQKFVSRTAKSIRR